MLVQYQSQHWPAFLKHRAWVAATQTLVFSLNSPEASAASHMHVAFNRRQRELRHDLYISKRCTLPKQHGACCRLAADATLLRGSYLHVALHHPKAENSRPVADSHRTESNSSRQAHAKHLGTSITQAFDTLRLSNRVSEHSGT